MARFDAYRTDGSAAYNMYGGNTAQPLEQPQRLPAAPVRKQPEKRTKTRLEISLFTILGTATAIFMLFLVIFSYVRMYEVQSEVADLQEQKQELAEQEERLRSQFENALDLTAIEVRARELGMREPLPSQVVYVEVAAEDTVEVYTVAEDRNIFEQVYDAFRASISDMLAYFS